jgi:serine/threonine protein kinase
LSHSDKQAPPIVKRIVSENIRNVYMIGKIIGSGNFGTVRLATHISNPNKLFAVKSIPREKIEAEIGMLE